MSRLISSTTLLILFSIALPIQAEDRATNCDLHEGTALMALQSANFDLAQQSFLSAIQDAQQSENRRCLVLSHTYYRAFQDWISGKQKTADDFITTLSDEEKTYVKADTNFWLAEIMFKRKK